MREQPGILEDEPNPAALGRQEHPRRAVGEHGPSHRDPPGIRPEQPGDGGDDRALAAARRAEQRGHAGRRRGERRIEHETGEGVVQRNRKRHRPSAAPSRRPASSASPSPATASAIETSESRAAAASPPGACSAA